MHGYMPQGKAPTPPPIEKVEKAALRYKDEVFTGIMHAMAFEDLQAKYPKLTHDDIGGVIADGFTTSMGRFVSREEAFKMVHGVAQIGKQTKLTSQDLM